MVAAAFQTAPITLATPGPAVGLPDASALWDEEFQRLLETLPAGEQVFWGIPFDLAQADAGGRWLWLGGETPQRHLVLDKRQADYVILAHFCLPRDATGKVTMPGEILGRYYLELEDGTESETLIRRRFEVNDAWLDYGQAAFAARPHRPPVLLNWRGPHGNQWGRNQQSVDGSPYGRFSAWLANYWICALPNPRPQTPLVGVRFECVAGWIGIGGVTLFSGADNPLRHEPLATLRISSNDPLLDTSSIAVDLGLLGRRHSFVAIDPGQWLAADIAGWGETPLEAPRSELVVELTASRAATLTIDERAVSLGEVFDTGHASSSDRAIRVELLRAPTNWVRVHVIDKASGRPTPARIHIRSADGRYLPPYGHRHEVNDRWFEDYGADLLLGTTPYAYVAGEFDIELPSGPVYAELVKGFDYRPVRAEIAIAPGQRELTLEIDKPIDHRRAGWITADTHVHFLSPQTAWLEGQAEDINVVNLLATQWGDMYTNVADYTASASAVSRDGTIVWVGTENRQHFLGHMNSLGLRSETYARMCAGGPPESYLGDPVWTTMADWADHGRRHGALIVVPHFPMPYSEVVADVALGKIDGLEVRDFDTGVDTYAVREWYRLLNAGFRVAVVGGTDKMSAAMPLGGVRTYTRLGERQLSFDAWADAVRAGRTITSTGPYIHLEIEGATIGDEIRLRGNGGTLSVTAEASAFQPLSRLEIVYNGRVVADAEPREDRYLIRLSTNVHVGGGGWIAARCEGTGTLWHLWPMRPVAHTSPIYIVGASAAQPRPDLAYLQTIVEGGLTWLDALGTRADPQTHGRLRQTFLDAQEVLATKDKPPSRKER
jgi:hypothetical protein